MKHIYSIMAAAALLFTACEKDGEMLTASFSKSEGTELSTADTEFTLALENASHLALTVYWDELGEIVLSNPNAQAPSSMGIRAIQFAATEDFATVSEQSVSADAVAAQFTVSQLNNIAVGLGLQTEVSSPLYLRLKQALGENTEPVYGQALMINVTPYFVDMSKVSIIDRNSGEVTATIPAVSDGEYAGFMNASSWYNFYFVEGNGIQWGTLNDGTTGSAFLLTSETSQWNNWFPEPAGCYYVTMSSNSENWTATSVASMSMTAGSVNADMTYYSSLCAWSATFTTTEANAAIQLSESGNKYDSNTGDASYNTVSFSLTGDAEGALSYVDGSATTGISAGAAGTYTLVLYLADMKWELHEGEYTIPGTEEPEPPMGDFDEYLYMFYSWKSKWIDGLGAKLWSETRDGNYVGFFTTASSWDDELHTNFMFCTSDDASGNDATETIYGTDPADQHKLSSDSGCYTGWPTVLGLMCITVDMSALTWTEETLPICVSGDFNSWSLSANPLTWDSATNTWSATIEVGTIGYGIQIVIGSDWNYILGGSDGTIYVGGNNIMPAETGTYLLTVNLSDYSNMTYTLVKQ